MSDDGALLPSLRTLIRDDQRLADQSIEVGLDGHSRIILRGTVNSLSNKLYVQELVAAASSQEVDNYLTVTNCDGEGVLFENVCTALEEHPDIPNEVIFVRVSRNAVILRGYVHSEWIRLLAAGVVRAVPGVAEVINILTVSPNYAIRDANSGRRISETLHTRLRDCVLRAAVDGEVVQVSGIIGAPEDEAAVKQVVNELGAPRVQHELFVVDSERAS